MQKVLTAAEMREVDRLTTEKYGIPSILLMENAAHAVARVITEKLGGSVKGRSVLILCGKGNNGGDGAALARQLFEVGAEVAVELFGKVEDLSGDVRVNFDRIGGLDGLSLKEFQPSTFDHGIDGWMGNSDYDFADVLVDALFGTGISRPLNDFYNEQIEILNEWKARYGHPFIISVDIPTGLYADSSELSQASLQPDVTVTFTMPKPANVLAPASSFNGELIVADIGSPRELIDAQPSQLYLAEKEDVADWLYSTAFSADSYKKKRGHSLIIAGSREFSGAAVLAGNSAMRTGVGLVTLVTAASSKDATASRTLPEVMVRGVAETESGAVAEEAFGEIADLLEKADSVAIGSGLSQNESTRKFVEKVVFGTGVPVVVDADALNLLSPFDLVQKPAREQGRNTQSHDSGPLQKPAREQGRNIQSHDSGPLQKPAREQGRNTQHPDYALADARASALILTPHEGEFLRLLGENHPDVRNDRVAAVREFSQKHNVILVLKGERVLIGEPGGKVVVNPTGNSGLGKAGNGDTLTGIIAGFAAQANALNIDLFETVVAAVYIAGMAGDIAEKKFGKRVMTASDVRECLVEVFAEFDGLISN